MAINLPSGLNVTTTEPVDARLVLTKAEMLNAVADRFPDNYLCIAKDDGRLYIYNKRNTPNPTTGLFQLYEEIIDVPAAIKAGMESTAGKAAMAEAIGDTLPDAMAKAMSDEEKAQEIADAMFDSEHFAVTIDNKIDLAISTIEAIDGMA